MKRIIVLAVCLAPVLAYGGEVYTNADLERFQVPGAYTNADLDRIGSFPVQGKPAARLPAFVPSPTPGDFYQAEYNSLRRTRAALMAEIAYEEERIAFSESAFAGDTRRPGIRLGYRSRVAPLLEELRKRGALLGLGMDAIADEARRAGVRIDRR